MNVEPCLRLYIYFRDSRIGSRGGGVNYTEQKPLLPPPSHCDLPRTSERRAETPSQMEAVAAPPPAQDEHGLSAYELERLETIRNNNRVLVDLGLGPAPGAAPTSSTCSRTVAPCRSKREPTAPGRVS